MDKIGLVFLTLVNLILARNTPRVKTLLGVVEGTVERTYTGTPYFQFEGVPYAAPPVGRLRYENPRDPQKWNGVLNATRKIVCLQYNHFSKDANDNYAITGDEDCLYYNLYTPTLDQSANLDVIIHIHGGAFMFGSGVSWRPNFILNRPVVFVTFNYRLGPLGFLSTEDDVLPGNLGLRDQQQAIKWIKKNVKYFGGNPNFITLHGLSAGGASVQFHCLLPGSKGLFHRAIAESGTALNNWVLMEEPLEHATRLASLVDCPTSDSSQLKSCMKSKPAKLIVENVKRFQPFLYNPFSPWGIVVDGEWASEPVVPDHPLNLLIERKIHDVPLLMSYTTSEGLYPAAEFYAKTSYLERIDTEWDELMPHILMYNYTVDHRIINRVSQEIRSEYLGSEPVNRCTFSQLVKVVSDHCFVADIEKGLRLHSAGIKSPVWSYEYNYRASIGAFDMFSNTTKNLGVAHADDTILIMGHEPLTTPNDVAVSNLLLDMTLSFIAKGSPNISKNWKPVSKNVRHPLNVLRINSYDELRPLQRRYIGNRPFWDSLPFEENERLLNITLGF